MLTAYVRLLRSPRFLGYAIGGACSTTAFYGFMSASPFIFETQLHQPTQRVGLYYLLLMLGVAAGQPGRQPGRRTVAGADGAADRQRSGILGAALFALADATGLASVVTVVAPVACSWSGPGWRVRSPWPGQSASIRRRSARHPGMYGFIQMGYGMLCTVVVEAWHPGAVYPVAVVLLGSALLGQAAMSMAVRAEQRRSEHGRSA